MELADILTEDSVMFCAGVTSKRDILEKLARRGAELTGQSSESVFAAIDSRESLGSTGLGNGIAIPHGKLPGLDGVTAVFARLERPVDFDAVDDQPVDLIVMLLAPLGSGADHLKALALVARILRTDSAVEALRSADDPAKLREILTRQLTTSQAA